MLRIVLIPVFIIVYYLPLTWSNQIACAVFTFAAVTDLLDGYLARKLGQISKLGEFLDPVADKLMVVIALVLLVANDPGLIMVMPAAVIIGREITVSALREWMAEIGARSNVAVSIYGKIKTTAQMIALILLIYEEDLLGLPVYNLGLVCLYIATTLTLLSLFQYIKSAWPKLKESKTKQ
jgi:CDP-diacylglycerol--glycerol-3-phosphate 3-phosphatidyltransferase/cardiolipin synthase